MEEVPEELRLQALAAAVRFAEYRLRSSEEVRLRLRRYGYRDTLCESVVRQLQECGVLDDFRFASAYMEEMLRKGYGHRRVRDRLLSKRLSREVVESVMEGYPWNEERDRALKQALKRFGEPVFEVKKRSRAVDYLMRLGYSRSVAESAVDSAFHVDSATGPE